MAHGDDRFGRLSRELAGAAQRGEITALYQPLMALDSGRIVAAEALSRWRHPQLGVILPDEFIPIAEQTGLIVEIGDLMMHLGCAAVAEWSAVGLSIEVSINVSAVQLRNSHFADGLWDCVQSHSIDPHLVTVEVTESTPIDDAEAAAHQLRWLVSLGMSVSVDDFGTGHSSTSQVLALPATELKIDQSLVRDETLEAVGSLAQAVKFGKAHGLRIVAEGVETQGQLQRVRELQCDRAQGFLIAAPVPKHAIASLVAEGGRR